MANMSHLNILRQSIKRWNGWRRDYPDQEIDLSSANLSEANLSGADLSEADLNHANLSKANLSYTNLSRACLIEADLSKADLRGADLSNANLRQAILVKAKLSYADLSKADLIGGNLGRADLRWTDLTQANLSQANLRATTLARADMQRSVLIDTCLTNADLSGARVYGVSAWNTKLEGVIQRDLIITKDGEPEITVDNLEVAQFIHLLIHNKKIRDIINTITSKVVLILGRFGERKPILDAIRERLRHLDYAPVLFDFEKPANRDLTETVSTLAHMAKFIIADLTAARSVPQELTAIVPTLAVPLLPIIHKDHGPWGMWRDFYKYVWVLTEHRYESLDGLLKDLEDQLIPKALEKIPEIERLRRRDQQQIQP